MSAERGGVKVEFRRDVVFTDQSVDLSIGSNGKKNHGEEILPEVGWKLNECV